MKKANLGFCAVALAGLVGIVYTGLSTPSPRGERAGNLPDFERSQGIVSTWYNKEYSEFLPKADVNRDGVTTFGEWANAYDYLKQNGINPLLNHDQSTRNKMRTLLGQYFRTHYAGKTPTIQ